MVISGDDLVLLIEWLALTFEGKVELCKEKLKHASVRDCQFGAR
jgi:hypothetical protein